VLLTLLLMPPPHAPTLSCSSRFNRRESTHPPLLTRLRYSPHSLCGCTAESLPPSTPRAPHGSLLPACSGTPPSRSSWSMLPTGSLCGCTAREPAHTPSCTSLMLLLVNVSTWFSLWLYCREPVCAPPHVPCAPPGGRWLLTGSLLQLYYESLLALPLGVGVTHVRLIICEAPIFVYFLLPPLPMHLSLCHRLTAHTTHTSLSSLCILATAVHIPRTRRFRWSQLPRSGGRPLLIKVDWAIRYETM